jgi:hypothetical protein
MAFIVGVAIGLRVALGVMHPFWFPDSVDYDGLARSMLARGVYEVGGNLATRMPGYPVLLAGVYAVRGGVAGVMVLQGLMGGVIVWMAYLIGARCGGAGGYPGQARGYMVGLIAAGLAAVDPLSVAFSASVLSETAFTLALMVGLWIAIRLLEGGRFWWWILLGAVWGAAVYLRGSVIWCLVPVVVVIGCGRSWAGIRCHGWVGGVCAVLMMFVVLTPWQVRNFRLFGSHYFRLTTLEGISLYEAVYAGADGGPKQDVIPLPAEMRGMNEVQRNDEWSRRAWKEIWEHPGRVMWLAARKVGRTWTPFLNAGEFQNPLIQAGMGLWHVPLFILALLGIFGRGVGTKMKWLLLTPVLYFAAVHGLFLGSVRYRVPLMPIVCIFAAAGIAELWRRIGKRRGEVAV